MSKRLEDFIRANKDEFNDIEPRAELWGKIEQNLQLNKPRLTTREAKTFSLAFVVKVAASVIIVMGVCFALYLRNQNTAGVSLADINPAYAKQQMHYASVVQNKRSELKELAKSDPQLYKEFSKELHKMDSVYKKLNSDLATSPNQERVLRAMIRNLQVQTEVLNQQLSVIEQFNQMKKEQSNEIKDI
ncbi:hypothetical protein DJ568_11060 [Mucilaginibacter hurinus]|uniref:Anti-sigma factor n=1 Tax=Mucilaginibacter hurinus TaxID=2201324 RepID=A0A367GQL3_9SPHI|nr:hypothetical protein [Mucilaginibacter hurinus]RCH55003.1 hypothetical protein DJ568_11060 [Mucilaginibacter hurinus]